MILFANFPVQGKQQAEELRIDGYERVLGRMPRAVLTGIVADVLDGKIDAFDPAYLPTCAQLARLGDDRRAALCRERDARLAELEREEHPQIEHVPTPAECDRIDAALARFHAGLSTGADPLKKQTAEALAGIAAAARRRSTNKEAGDG